MSAVPATSGWTRSAMQGALYPVVEGPAQAPVARVPHEMGDPVGLGDLHRAVGRAVIDHQDDDLVDPVDRLGDRFQNERKGVFLVQTRDLDH